MRDELLERLAAEIQKSGIPTELQAVRELRLQKWLAVPSIRFQDIGGGVHEIDVYGSLIAPEHPEWPHFPPGIELAIECKKSVDKPWVFFEDNQEIVFFKDVFQRLRIHADNPAMRSWYLNLESTADRAEHHYADDRIPKARSYFEAFRKPGPESEIFSAFRSVWYAGDVIRRWFHRHTKSGDDRSRVMLVHPVVLFDGELVIARYRKRGGFTVHPVNHVVVRTVDAITMPTTSPLVEDNEVIVDVIRASHFRRYLKLCRSELENFAAHLRHREAAGQFPPAD